MSELEFKKQDNKLPVIENIHYDSVNIGLPYAPMCLPAGIPTVNKVMVIKKAQPPPPLAIPGSNLPRAINYLADYSGCGWWRLGAPELLLNYGQKMIINSLTTMIVDERFYGSGFCAVKLQRQATPVQKEFVKFLKHVGKRINTKIIYEVDDIVFSESIPHFNRCRSAFVDPEIRNSIEQMIEMCDEMCVVSEYMKDYYKSKTKQQKITVIPNYAPRMWFDRYYNLERLETLYNKNKKRPRILVTASGTHFDLVNATNQKDDYSHILQDIIKSRKDFEWVFQGGYPLLLRPFIDNGEIKFRDWSPLLNFAQGMYDAEAQLTIAALEKNDFNRAKSFIKLTEAGHLGLPFVGQRLEPYKNAFYQFDSGVEMIDHIKNIIKDEDRYLKACKQARHYADGFWLDDDKNLGKHIELYTTTYGNKDRKYLLENNSEQFKPDNNHTKL